MAHVQKQFEAFVNKIKLGTTDEEATLREKRDEVLKALREGLKENFEAKGKTVPQFRHFNQGSYSLKTGIRPVGTQQDYDIDVGVVLDIDQSDHTDDPAKPKRWVKDALEGRVDAESIDIKTPCVTVTYADGCHVDLAVYADPEMRTDTELALSWGKETSSSKEWQTNHPSELARRIKARFPDDEERTQFRRVLRALKRWRDLKYKNATSHAAPVGVGLTVAGLSMFSPQRSVFHGTDDDRLATELFVQALLDGFGDYRYSDKDQAYGRRLEVELPFTPYRDVFARINNNNMGKLEELLRSLLDDLKEARSAETSKAACEAMRRQFGDDFPEGDDEDASTDGAKSETQSRAIIGSYLSG